MLQADQRQALPDHCGDLAGAIAGGIDDDLGDDRATLRRYRPAAVGTRVDCRDRVEPIDLGAAVAGAAREGLGELAGVDVAVIGVPQPALDVVELDQRMARLDLVGADQLERDPLRPRHRRDMGELLHPRRRMGEADRTGDMVVDRVIDLRAEALVERVAVALQLQDVPARREGRAITRRMPGRARGQLVALGEGYVGPAPAHQMIERAAPDGAAADDQHPDVALHFCSSAIGATLWSPPCSSTTLKLRGGLAAAPRERWRYYESGVRR